MFKKNFALYITVISFVFWFFYVLIINPDTKTLANEEDPKKSELSKIKEIRGLVKVIDGDSLLISGKYEIRLKNIDAPEYQQKCLNKDNYEYFCGKMAKNFLKKMLLNQEVLCIYEKKDYYNRFLSECFFNQKNIAYELIKNGMAITYFFDEKKQDLEYAQKTARSKKVGIWQGAFLEPAKYRKLKKK